VLRRGEKRKKGKGKEKDKASDSASRTDFSASQAEDGDTTIEQLPEEVRNTRAHGLTSLPF